MKLYLPKLNIISHTQTFGSILVIKKVRVGCLFMSNLKLLRWNFLFKTQGNTHIDNIEREKCYHHKFRNKWNQCQQGDPANSKVFNLKIGLITSKKWKNFKWTIARNHKISCFSWALWVKMLQWFFPSQTFPGRK